VVKFLAILHDMISKLFPINQNLTKRISKGLDIYREMDQSDSILAACEYVEKSSKCK